MVPQPNPDISKENQSAHFHSQLTFTTQCYIILPTVNLRSPIKWTILKKIWPWLQTMLCSAIIHIYKIHVLGRVFLRIAAFTCTHLSKIFLHKHAEIWHICSAIKEMRARRSNKTSVTNSKRSKSGLEVRKYFWLKSLTQVNDEFSPLYFWYFDIL